MWAIISVLLVFFGEFFSILSELLFSKGKINFFLSFFIVSTGGLALILGYYYGYKHLKDMWLVYIVSITAILIIEPILIFFITGESPNLGARLGFLFGIIGFLCTFFIK